MNKAEVSFLIILFVTDQHCTVVLRIVFFTSKIFKCFTVSGKLKVVG